jgi:mRNA interferase MazF
MRTRRLGRHGRTFPGPAAGKSDRTRPDSKAQAGQIRSVAVERIGKRIGQLLATLITQLDHAICIHLSL